MRLGVIAAAAVALAAALALPSGAAAARGACARTGDDGHVAAVFGYRATRPQAAVLQRAAAAVGFRQALVRRVDCGLWQVALSGLDTAAQQLEFASEAREAGFEVSFDTLHGPPPPAEPGEVRAVFGSFTTVAAADTQLRRVASVGFRTANVFRRGNRYTVEILHVPLAKAQAFAQQVRRARLTVSFEV